MRHHVSLKRASSIGMAAPSVRPVAVKGVEVFDGSPEAGWRLLVTYTDGSVLPSTLLHPSLLADFLDYYGLPETVVTYHGASREQIEPMRARTVAQADLALSG